MPLISLPPDPHFNLHGYVEVRERFERRLNRDFDVTASDNRSDFLTRVRIGARLAYGTHWRGQFELQYAEDGANVNGVTTPADNRDMSIGYVEAGSAGWTGTVGRQKINYGQQRLIGASEWTNVSRSFDAVRARGKGWDAFAGKVGLQFPYPAHARVAAFQRQGSRGTSLYVYKHDTSADIHTIDHSISKGFGAVVLDAEGAIQAGRVSGKDQQAWAAHIGLTGALAGRLKPFAIFDAASGGSTTNTNRTFDNLYPTNHGKFGIADMAGWKNIQHFALGFDYALRKDISARAAWHHLELQDAKDAWYSATGAPNKHGATLFRDATGASGRNLGNEFDLDLSYQATKSSVFSAGVAWFRPGPFVKSVAGHADPQVFGYVQYGTRF